MSSAHTINTYLGYWLKPFYHSSKEDVSMEKAKQEIIWADRTSICLQHTEKCIPLVRNLACLYLLNQNTVKWIEWELWTDQQGTINTPGFLPFHLIFLLLKLQFWLQKLHICHEVGKSSSLICKQQIQSAWLRQRMSLHWLGSTALGPNADIPWTAP